MKKNKENKRIASVIKLKYNDLNYKISTVDKVQTKTIYVTLDMWMNADISIEDSIKAIRRRFIKNIGPISRIYFDDLKTHLIDYTYPVTKECIIKNKWTFVSIIITLYPKDGTTFTWNDELFDNASGFASSCFDLLYTLDDKFQLRSTKKV